jgi:hypothetical protein
MLLNAGYASSGSDCSPPSLNSDTQVVCGFAIDGSCLLYICTLLLYMLLFQLSGLGLSSFLIESICDGIPTGLY